MVAILRVWREMLPCLGPMLAGQIEKITDELNVWEADAAAAVVHLWAGRGLAEHGCGLGLAHPAATPIVLLYLNKART